jgi:hypothetical protein
MCKTSERRIKLYLPGMPPSSARSSAAEVLWGYRRSSCSLLESRRAWELRTTRSRCWPSSTGRAASRLPTSSRGLCPGARWPDRSRPNGVCEPPRFCGLFWFSCSSWCTLCPPGCSRCSDKWTCTCAPTSTNLTR